MIPTIAGVEFEKISRRRFSPILLALLVILQVVLAVAGFKVRMKNMELGTGFQVSAFSIQYVLQLMTLIVLAISSSSLSGEISSGTVKTVLARNVKRRDFLLGKFFALLFISTLVLLLIYALGLAAGKFSGGLVSLKDGDYLLCPAGKLFGSYLVSFLMFIPPLVALISFGIFISVLIRGAGGAVGTGIISFFVLQMLSQLDFFEKYLFTRYLTLPIDNYYKLTEGIYLSQKSSIYWSLGVSSAYFIVFISLSLLIFCKKDIWR